MKIGDKVTKIKGYNFYSTIVAKFKTSVGNTRVVAENEAGILHIFNEGQLQLASKNTIECPMCGATCHHSEETDYHLWDCRECLFYYKEGK